MKDSGLNSLSVAVGDKMTQLKIRISIFNENTPSEIEVTVEHTVTSNLNDDTGQNNQTT